MIRYFFRLLKGYVRIIAQSWQETAMQISTMRLQNG